MESTFPLNSIMLLKRQDLDQIIAALDSAKNIIQVLLASTPSAPNGFALSIEFRVNLNTGS